MAHQCPVSNLSSALHPDMLVCSPDLGLGGAIPDLGVPSSLQNPAETPEPFPLTPFSVLPHLSVGSASLSPNPSVAGKAQFTHPRRGTSPQKQGLPRPGLQGTESSSSSGAPLFSAPYLLPPQSAAALPLTPATTHDARLLWECHVGQTMPAVRGENELFRMCHIGEMVGEGRYGCVWECVHRASGARLACKQVQRQASPKGALELELACLARAQGHPNVLDLEQVYQGRESTFIITELCNSGDLYDHICRRGRLPEDEARVIFSQVVGAVRHCHERGVLHRDIKPENVLLHHCSTTGQTRAKLADFGLSTVLNTRERTVGWVGSEPYEAPEVVSQQEYGCAADVFSLGVLLFSMLSGSWPSFARGKHFLPEEDFKNSLWKGLSAEAKDLITRMLTHDPELRPSASRILHHPWMIENICKASLEGMLSLTSVIPEHQPNTCPTVWEGLCQTGPSSDDLMERLLFGLLHSASSFGEDSTSQHIELELQL